MQSTVLRPQTWEVSSTLDIRYEIKECSGLLDPDNPALAESPEGTRTGGTRLVIVDHAVQRLHGASIARYLGERNVPYRLLVLSGEERHKTMGQVFRIVGALNELGTRRVSDPPVAIGGGVVLDVVGLAASLYRRGIPFVRVPTTLLSLVDVSVAVKTGVNYQGYRNRLGSYSPPPLTLLDDTFLRTLDRRQVSNGAGEILKMALIKDEPLFRLLERQGRMLVDTRFHGSEPARQAVRAAIGGMLDELRPNLWEKDLERIVDYGHSFSPLVEMTFVDELLHGEAVAIDCLLSAVIAAERGYLEDAHLDRILATMAGLGLPLWHRGFDDVELLGRALADTVKHRNGRQNLPMLTGIGKTVFLNDVSSAEIARAAARAAGLALRAAA
ncbi:sedoheptulose 7-phosphate cyclase [Kitasatospora xanthocidica]|uniref:sedoheptulose 7-phosphate cyclase n=1 Tax=Kitasatospora xanthocidica TaxID=83382 RepID=UPI0036EA4EC9